MQFRGERNLLRHYSGGECEVQRLRQVALPIELALSRQSEHQIDGDVSESRRASVGNRPSNCRRVVQALQLLEIAFGKALHANT